MFHYQKLDVYRSAIACIPLAHRLAARVPRGYGDLADQLRRSTLSVPLNIAEATGRFDQDARRFYAIARGSALECAAILDVCEALAIDERDLFSALRAELLRVVSMLTVMVRRA